MNRRLVLTGATGFIGSRSIEGLNKAGWSITAIGRESTDWSKLGTSSEKIDKITWTGDIAKLTQDIVASSPDACLHLATQFVGAHQPQDIDALCETNLRFGMQLADACAQVENLAFVNVGTMWQHADSRDYAPTSLYAATKQAFADILRFYSDFSKLRVLNLKLADSFGPNDPRPKLFSALIKAARSGEVLEMSAGEELITPLYIDDVVAGFARALELVVAQTDNWIDFRVTTTPLMVRELVDRFNAVTGTNLEVKWGARPYRIKEMFEPWEYGEMLPGWSPKTSLDEGIAQVWKAANS